MRFQVAVNDALIVDRLHAVRNLLDHPGCLIRRQWHIVAHQVRKVAAWDQFHAVKRPSLDLSHLKDANDVWMVERAGGLRLDPETLDDLGIGLAAGQHYLEGHRPQRLSRGPELACPVYDTHAAALDLLHQFVMPESSWQIAVASSGIRP